MLNLSIILPVHNESLLIIQSVTDIERVLDKAKIIHELIFVENGSTDDSYLKLQKLKREIKNAKLIRSEIGWGNAVRAGIWQAQADLVCYMVSDGQIDAKFIVELYEKYQENIHNPSIALYKIWRTNRENATRLVNSRSYNFISRLLFGLESWDINATPKLMETKLLKSLTLTSENIAIDLELMLKLKKLGLTWREIPVPSKKRDAGKSTTNLNAVWEMLSYMVKFRLGGLV
jgi:glycosyltransferase involved in cell wall biosynthesis